MNVILKVARVAADVFVGALSVFVGISAGKDIYMAFKKEQPAPPAQPAE